MDFKTITTPFTTEKIKTLRAGDAALLTGVIITARDAAHERITRGLAKGDAPPFDFDGQAVYYAGPAPAPPGRVIGSAGPTTSSRMDAYAPRLIAEGLRVMIGKGPRSEPVLDAIREHCGVYFAAIGGAGALLSLCVKDSQIIAYADLGPEAVYKLTVSELPLIVAADCYGGNIYSV